MKLSDNFEIPREVIFLTLLVIIGTFSGFGAYNFALFGENLILAVVTSNLVTLFVGLTLTLWEFDRGVK